MAFASNKQTADGQSHGTVSATDVPPPDLRGTRTQAMQRLQVGIGGLAAMVLVVGLASTIMQQARQSEDPARPVAAAEPEEKAGDPLVDAGVVPNLPSEQVVVPDLPAEKMVEEQPPADRTDDAEVLDR